MGRFPAVSEQYRAETANPDETRHLGERLGTLLDAGDVVHLQGELGAGKTTFVQGIAQGMGYEGQVSSKSFVIMGEYAGREKLYHADLYRLEEPEQVEELGLGELTEDGVLVVEWPERGGWALPEGDVVVRFEVRGESERALNLEAGTDRGSEIISTLEDGQ
jgi:tRNA threonylcarbamoyladenosine biosynthesis protein TsaE